MLVSFNPNFKSSISYHISLNTLKMPQKNINFCATDSVVLSGVNNQAEQFVEELKVLKKVHCATCGDRVLPENKFNSILLQASDIRNAGDFAELLSDNEYLIKREKLPFVNFALNYTSKNPSASTYEFMVAAKSEARHKLNNALVWTSRSLTEQINAGKYSPTESKAIDITTMWMDSILSSVRPTDKFPIEEFKNGLKEMLEEVPSHKKWEIHALMGRKIFNKAELYNMLITGEGFAFSKPVDIVKELLEKSKSQVVKIAPDGKFHMVMCTDCSNELERSGSFKKFAARKQNLFSNLTRYGQDIFYAIGEGNLSSGRFYPENLTKYIKQIIFKK